MNRVHLRPSAGLRQRRSISPPRVLKKYLGLLVTLLVLAFLYSVLPEYSNPRYSVALQLMTLLLAAIVLGAVPYLAWIDSRADEPEDTAYLIGSMLLGNRERPSRLELKRYCLEWVVKGFFLPVMLAFLVVNIENLTITRWTLETFAGFVFLTATLIYTIDVTFGAVGYLLTLRGLDAHIRNADQHPGGWVVALACYPPLSQLIGESYTSRPASEYWINSLQHQPVLYISWAFFVLVLLGLYLWATICFGCRFSNLTHRGIITYGPYSFTKHPAYVFKCSAWCLMATPLILGAPFFLAVQAAFLLLLQCGIYALRAKAEERHLSADPAYVAYCQSIDEHGFLRNPRQWFESRFANRHAVGSPRVGTGK